MLKFSKQSQYFYFVFTTASLSMAHVKSRYWELATFTVSIEIIRSLPFSFQQWLPVHSLCIFSLVAKHTQGNNWENNYLLWSYNSKFIQNTCSTILVIQCFLQGGSPRPIQLFFNGPNIFSYPPCKTLYNEFIPLKAFLFFFFYFFIT